MNNMIFKTGGDWDSTTLFNNNQELPADELLVELHAGRDEDGEPMRGGVRDGGEATAIVRPQNDPQSEMGIFPGRLEMHFPQHTIVIENMHPTFAFEFTRVWYNREDVTSKVVDVYVDVNALENQVKAYITLYKSHFLGSDEVATFNIIG